MIPNCSQSSGASRNNACCGAVGGEEEDKEVGEVPGSAH